MAEALTQAIFPWSAKLLYYLDHSLFKDMMLRIVPNSFRYARAVYMLCRELDSPPPIIQQYLD